MQQGNGGLDPQTKSRLAGIPCLTSLDPALIEKLGAGVTFRNLAKGAALVRQEAALNKIVMVVSGTLKVFRTGEQGEQQTWQILGPGDCICFAPAHNRSDSPVTIQSMSDARVAFIDGRQLESVSGDSKKFTANVMDCVLSRYTRAVQDAGNSARSSVRRKVASVLLALAGRQEPPKGNGESILVDGITHEELASLTGSVREVVSRALEQLQREGVIRTGRGRVEILSSENLRMIGSGATR